ncbi:MAG: amino acid ABC transporter ATP-binding protein [Sporomusa sp.]
MEEKVLLQVRNLNKSFGKTIVLRDVSFDVCQGDRLSIIGPSGSGKTTLLRCINGLEKPSGGHVIIDGTTLNINSNDVHKIREKVGFIFQRFNLFSHLTVLDNLMLAQKIVKKRPVSEAKEISLDLLKKVGLSGKTDAYPSQLSGGQQQRVAIARALAMEPVLLLMDEITSALDPELVGEVLEVVRDLAKSGMTMILVTHEMGFAKNVANKVIFMADGEIVEQGSPEQLFKNPQQERTQAFLKSVLRHD